MFFFYNCTNVIIIILIRSTCTSEGNANAIIMNKKYIAMQTFLITFLIFFFYYCTNVIIISLIRRLSTCKSEGNERQ